MALAAIDFVSESVDMMASDYPSLIGKDFSTPCSLVPDQSPGQVWLSGLPG